MIPARDSCMNLKSKREKMIIIQERNGWRTIYSHNLNFFLINKSNFQKSEQNPSADYDNNVSTWINDNLVRNQNTAL